MRVLATVVLAGAWLAIGPVLATECPPGLPCVSEPWETVGLEHRDRVARLLRLGAGRQGFDFFEETISSAEHGLADFPTDIPILRVVADNEVFFDSGRDVIRPEALPVLDIIAQNLKREPPDVTLFVAGHTDSDGTFEYNMELGQRRAAAVAAALVRRGIYQAGIYRVSFGEHMPLASNATPRGKARNRRVEFLFSARTEVLVTYLAKQEIEFCPAHVSDAVDTCRQELSFEVQELEVPLEFEKQVIELEEESQEIVIAEQGGAPSIEIEKRRQEVEFRRQQIPIEIESEKIIIDFEAE